MANVKNFLFSLNNHTIVPCAVDLGHADDNMTVAMTFQVLSADEIAGGTVTAEFEIGEVKGLAGNVTVSDSEITVVFSKAMMATEGIGKIQIVVAYPDESLWHSNIVQYRVHSSLKAGDSVPTAEVTAFEKALADYASKAENLNTIAKTAQDIQPALDALKNTAVATDTSVGLMSAEDKAKLNGLNNPLIVYATKQEKAATDVYDKYTLDHPAKEIYDAAASGRDVRVYVKRSAISQSVTEGISASYELSSFTLFKKEPVKYTVFFKASSSDSLGGDEQYEDQNEKVRVKGNKVTDLYLSMQPADGTLAISSTWSAYDGRPALDLVKTHIRSELSAVSDRVATLESASNVLVLTASANTDTSTQSTYPYVVNHTAKEIYDAFIAGKTILIKLIGETYNGLITTTTEGDKYRIEMQIKGWTFAVLTGDASEKKIKIITD